MASQPEYESLTLDIYGPPLRVRVPVEQVEDVQRAAALLKARVEEAKDSRESAERILIRAALEIAYEAQVIRQNTIEALRHLLQLLDHELKS